MSKPAAEASYYLASFKGTDEREDPSISPTYVQESLNVEFKDGNVRRRHGRIRILDSTLIKPTKIVQYYGGTGVAQERFTTIDNPFSHGASALYFGFPFRTVGINVTINTPVDPGCTLTVTLFKRDSGGGLGQYAPLTVGIITDGTASGGSTFQQTGSVTWGAGNLTTAWTIGSYTGIAALDALLDPDLYWVKFNGSGAFANGQADKLRGSWTSNNPRSIRAESNGITSFVTSSGNQFIVSTHDFPSRFINDTDAVSTLTENRVISYNMATGDAVPVRIPESITVSGDPGAFVSYVAFNGWLIGATTSGYLWKFNGQVCGELECISGMDAQKGVLGADQYLLSTPRGRLLNVYHSKLMVAGCPDEPLSFYASLEDNNISMIPSVATVGGPNVWPIKYAYRIPGKNGEQITGTSVVNDRYIIFTRSSTWWFDEVSLREANSDIGCIAPGSVQRCGSMVFFLSDLGIGATDGLNSSIISEPVRKTLSIVNWTMAHRAVSAHDVQNSEYWLWLPIHGGMTNTLAVVFNYKNKSWRTVSSWYPFDTLNRRDTYSAPHNVSASTTMRDSTGTIVVITVDTLGVLYQENVGHDDAGTNFPAYIKLRKLEVQENYSCFRHWYLGLYPDGQWFTCIALGEGDRLDQELDRLYSNTTTNSESVLKQALLQNCVGGTTQPVYTTGTGWDTAFHTPRKRKLKLSFGRNLTKMEPVIIWTPGFYTGGVYTPTNATAHGEISDIQIETTPKHQAR